MKYVLFAILFLIWTGCSFTQDFGNNTHSQNPSAREIYENTQNSIVFIVCYDENSALQAYGSGVIISEDGLVYTNHHVIDNVKHIQIRNGETIYQHIQIVGFNPLFDAAVLKIVTEEKFPDYVKTNTSVPPVGEILFALGNPLGYKKTLSEGLLSGRREVKGINQIQYTASISPGSSGGALFNSGGELIGITCSSYEKGQNLNFAIPVSYFNNISLINYNDTLEVSNMLRLFEIYNNVGTYEDYRRFEAVARFLAFTPPSVNTYLLAAEVYKKFGRTENTAECLTKAIDLDPENKLLYKLRGDAYTNLSERDSAISDYNKALSLDSFFIDAYLGRAYAFETILNDYTKAASDYTSVINIEPEFNYLYSRRSDCFLSLGDTTKALEDLSKSFGFEQRYHFDYSKRAALYSDLKMYDEAIWDYTEAIKLNPDFADYYLSRAILYSKTGRHLLAIDDYRMYTKFVENDVLACNNMAYCYMSDGDYANAERFFEKSLSGDPRHLDSYLGLAVLNFRQGNTKKAISKMYESIKLEPLLENGLNGIKELEKSGWFWDEDEKQDMKKIFKIMKINSKEIKKPSRKKKTSAEEPG